MDFIRTILNELNVISATAPFVGGVVALAVTGTLGFLLVKLPKQISKSVSSMFVVNFVVNNGGWGTNQVIYGNVLSWFRNFDGKKVTRSYSFEETGYETGTVGPGNGRHYIWFKGIPLLVHVTPLDSSGSEKVKKEIQIKTLFIFRKKFFEIVDMISTIETKAEKKPTIRNFVEGNWKNGRPLAERRLETIVAEGTVIEDIVALIDEFLASREWYRTRGIPYKLTILLYGPPGTGKTSLVKALAYHYSFSVAPVPIHSCTDVGFVNAVNALPARCFMLMEDIDTGSAVRDKSGKEGDLVAGMSSIVELNLATLINTIDGVADLDGQIIFMSTNHPDKLDPRLYRSERVDKCILMDYLTVPTIERYTRLVYPGLEFELPVSEIRIPGSKLQSVFKENRRSPEKYLAEVSDMLLGKTEIVNSLPKL